MNPWILDVAARRSPHAGDGPWVVAGAVIIGPAFIALGVWMIRRPAEVIRGYRFWSENAVQPWEIIWCRAFGCAWLAFMIFWCAGVIWWLVSEV